MARQAELESADDPAEYSRAVLVGWRLAQLYANPTHTAPIQPVHAEAGYLPQIPEKLDETQQAKLIWTRLGSDLSKLPGGDNDNISKAIAGLDTALEESEFDQKAIADHIESVFKKTLANVSVIDPHLARAFNLGRQLADLVFGPARAPGTFVGLEVQLSQVRVQKTCSLLDELQSSFPLRATAAVTGSLVYWRKWAETHPGDDAAAREKLRAQGERWRSLLTGEIYADDLLNLNAYRAAVGEYFGQLILLFRRNKYLWITVLALLAITAGGIYAIVRFAPAGAAVVAGIIAAAAGALGITWKTVAVTLGKASALLEKPVLDDGLKEAVKAAAFIQPPNMTPAEFEALREAVRVEAKQEQRELESSAKAGVPSSTGNDTQSNAASSPEVPAVASSTSTPEA